LGEHNQDKDVETMPNGKTVRHLDLGIEKYQIHRKYKQYLSYHDIALIK
jgi:hypothetical protein